MMYCMMHDSRSAYQAECDTNCTAFSLVLHECVPSLCAMPKWYQRMPHNEKPPPRAHERITDCWTCQIVHVENFGRRRFFPPYRFVFVLASQILICIARETRVGSWGRFRGEISVHFNCEYIFQVNESCVRVTEPTASKAARIYVPRGRDCDVRARCQRNVSYIVFNKRKTVYHLTAFYHFRQTPRSAHLIVDTN